MASKTQTQRILVTGGGGFVGQTFVRLAKERLPGVEICAADRAPLADGGFLELDVTDAATVDKVVAEVRPYGILHLAGMAAVSEATRDPAPAWAVNFWGTMNLAQAARRHVPDARFVFVGSADIYGGTFNALPGPLDESAQLDPLSVYAATKAAADLMIGQMVHDGFNAVRFRPFNHTGPGQADKFVVASFAQQIARIERGLNAPAVSVGNIEIRRDFLDARDVAEAYLRVLDPAREFPRGGVYNLASGTTRRIGDILQELLARSPASIRVTTASDRFRANEMKCTIGNAARAHADLGWSPRIPWTQTLEDTLDFARKAIDQSTSA